MESVKRFQRIVNSISRSNMWRCMITILCFCTAIIDTVEAESLQRTSGSLVQCPPESVCSVCQFEGHHLDLRCENLHKSSPDILKPLFQEVANLTTKLTFIESNLSRFPEGICLLKNLEDLDVSNNNLNWNAIMELSCYKMLKILIADFNDIENLEAELFDALVYLHSVSLKYNNITECDTYQVFKTPKNLRQLQMSHNSIHTMDIGVLKLPSVLESNLSDRFRFNLSFNKIEKWSNIYNVRLNDLPTDKMISLVLDLRKNNIQYIRNIDFFKILDIKNRSSLWGLWNCGFLLMDNPYDCDCDMYNLVNLTWDFVRHFINLQDILLLDVTCASPPAAADKRIVDVYYKSRHDFRCFINNSCEEGFQCEYRPANKTMEISIKEHSVITKLPEIVPPAKQIELHFSGSEIEQLEDKEYLKNVSVIDFSNSALKQINSRAIVSLAGAKKLYFQNSNLTSFPNITADMKNLSWNDLTLANNPFICDCHLGGLKRFIQDSDIVENKRNIKCTNGKLLGRQVTDVELYKFACNYIPGDSEIWNIVFFCILSATFVMSISAVVVHHNIRFIQMKYLKAFNKKLRFGKSKKLKLIKQDIAVQTHDQDEKFVENVVLPEIEEKAGYSLFFQARDKDPTRLTMEEMFENMEASRCIMPIISKSALQDPYFGLCFRRAFDFFIEYDDKVIILILLSPVEELLSTRGIDKGLKYFLNLHCVKYVTYRKQEERGFVNTLLQELQNSLA